ncbi:homoserine kinase [soil metagenome]
MAVYTDISDAELDAFLADFDLGAPLAFKGIAEGVSNSNFLLETERGRFILTVYERRTDEAELPYFLGLMRWLADHDFPSAAPVADRNGVALKQVRGKPAALATFLTGLSARRPTMELCRESGRGLAWLHEAASGYPGRRYNALGQAEFAGLFDGLEAAAERLKPGLAVTIASDLDDLARQWPASLPAGTIHGDFFPDNVFFRERKFAAAIDFYFACDDALAYDIGCCLNAWCFEPDGSFNVTSARNFIAGYESRRPLSGPERAALPILARGAAMRFFLTRLADWGATPEGALVKPHDPLEYERKLAVHRAGIMLLPEAP